MTEELFIRIMDRLLQKADLALEEKNLIEDDFSNGVLTGYHEVLDSIKSELLVEGLDVSQYGLDIDLENTYS